MGMVSRLVAKALEVLAKEAIKEAKSLRGARGELEKLRQTFDMIRAHVHDAERYRGEERQEFVKEWLLNMKHVLYQVDDLFDKVLTLDRLDQQSTTRGVVGSVRNFFSKSNPLHLNRKLVNEIKAIRKQLIALKSNMDYCPLPTLPPQQQSLTSLIEVRETGSFVDPSNVIGRANDAKKIIDLLLDPKYDGEQITVIPIVGFGGLGKTTLAQLVFNDNRVKEHFEPTAWAYVPERNHINAIKRKIYKAFTHKNSQNPTMVDIEEGIRGLIANNKYLLVLDDLWVEEGADLTNLLKLLKQGGKGSKVIVTTRLDRVALQFGPIEAAHKLNVLTDDDSWELLKKFAFMPGQESKDPGLSRIGRDIANMCGNVPLAIEVVAGSLLSNHTHSHWLHVKNDLSKTDNNRFMAYSS